MRVPREDNASTTYTHGAHEIDVLITGVGMVATAAWCSRALTQSGYDLALNFGVCGSFDAAPRAGHGRPRRRPIGSPSWALKTASEFLTLDDLAAARRVGRSSTSTRRPTRSSISCPRWRASPSTPCTATSGRSRRSTERFQPQVESMEGAAFMSACLMHEVQFAQVRAVSNIVERRNRGAWKMAEAIAQPDAAALRIIEARMTLYARLFALPERLLHVRRDREPAHRSRRARVFGPARRCRGAEQCGVRRRDRRHEAELPRLRYCSTTTCCSTPAARSAATADRC